MADKQNKTCYLDPESLKFLEENIRNGQLWTRLKSDFKAFKTAKAKDLQSIATDLDKIMILGKHYEKQGNPSESYDCFTTILKALTSVLNKDCFTNKVSDFMKTVIESAQKQINYIGSYCKCGCNGSSEHTDAMATDLLKIVKQLHSVYVKRNLPKGDLNLDTLLKTKASILDHLRKYREAIIASKEQLRYLETYKPDDHWEKTKCIYGIASTCLEAKDIRTATKFYHDVLQRFHQFHPDFKNEGGGTLLFYLISLFHIEKTDRLMRKNPVDKWYKNYFECIESIPEKSFKSCEAYITMTRGTAVIEIIENGHRLPPAKIVEAFNARENFGGCLDNFTHRDTLKKYIHDSTQEGIKLCRAGKHYEAILIWEEARFLANRLFRHSMVFEHLAFCYCHHIQYFPEAYEVIMDNEERSPFLMFDILYANQKYDEALKMIESMEKVPLFRETVQNMFRTCSKKKQKRTAQDLLGRLLEEGQESPDENSLRLAIDGVFWLNYCFEKRWGSVTYEHHHPSWKVNKFIEQYEEHGYEAFVLVLEQTFKEDSSLEALTEALFDDRNLPFRCCKIFVNLLRAVLHYDKTKKSIKKKRYLLRPYHNSLLISTHMRNYLYYEGKSKVPDDLLPPLSD